MMSVSFPNINAYQYYGLSMSRNICKRIFMLFKVSDTNHILQEYMLIGITSDIFTGNDW